MKVGDLVEGRYGGQRTGIVIDKYIDKDTQTNDPKFMYRYTVLWAHSRRGTITTNSGWHDMKVINEN